MNGFCRLTTSAVVAFAFSNLAYQDAQAVTIDWLTVGDPGNAADTFPSGYGAVANSFQIMKYEFMNQQ